MTPKTPSLAIDQLSAQLQAHIAHAIKKAGGWLGFDLFMHLALYTPGLGYYANGSAKFGAMPDSGSDFVTAPEMSPLFGQTLAVQIAQALAATATCEVWEFGAGSGMLASQLLDALGNQVQRYTIVEVSDSLRARQQQRLAPYVHKLRWLRELPHTMQGVVLGNELLDAMPVRLLVRLQGRWHERGVALHHGQLQWADLPTDARPPLEPAGAHDYLTEIHPQAEAFVRTLADRLTQGAAFLIDYGFAEAEYYHPQRHMGTVMCHRGHQADGNPLVDVGLKDITAHVNFTGVALAAQEAGLQVLGYTTQARFLMNCGLPEKMETANFAGRAAGAKLIHEHEMGELFKVVALGARAGPGDGPPWEPLGFAQGDRSHRL